VWYSRVLSAWGEARVFIIDSEELEGPRIVTQQQVVPIVSAALSQGRKEWNRIISNVGFYSLFFQ
jgi:hypothetical protein